MNPDRITLVALFAMLSLVACKQQQAQTAAAPPPTPVTVGRATQETIPVQLRVVGTVEASEVVQVKSQVAGQIMSVHFTEGQSVAKGALLFEIDARPAKEALRQTEAAIARDRAQLRQAEATLARDAAQLKNADADAGRYDELSKAGIISKAQADQVRTQADVYRESSRASQAAIETVRAAIESDRAAIDKAKLDIAYSSIHAPISGRAGNLLVNAGNLVKVNDVPLVVLHQASPVFATFNVPEQHLGAIRRLSANRKLDVTVALKDNPERTAQGHVIVIDNTVDATTGTIRLKAVFENRDGMLWPGQFVNVVLTLDAIQNATVIPAEALQNGQKGTYVYLVKPDNTVEMRLVSAGLGLANRLVIEKGLAPGDTVVTDGQLRLAPGARIQAVDAAEKQ